MLKSPRNNIVVAIMICLLPTVCSALEAEKPTSNARAPEASPVNSSEPQNTTPAKTKTTYNNFSLGYAFPNYGSDTDRLFQTLQSLPGYSRLPLAFSLGAYRTTEDLNFMEGISILGIFDDVKATSFDLKIYQISVAYTAVLYSGPKKGIGPFIRGDVGEGFAYAQLNNSSGNKLAATPYYWALLTQLGFGYSIPVSDKVSLSLGLYGSVNWIPGATGTNTSIQLGCLL